MIEECKLKISKEYFPVAGRKKAKMRRSVAQKHIRHFIRLGVEPSLVADLMFYNIEIAQTYSTNKYTKHELFYKAMLKAFGEVMQYTNEHGIRKEFVNRIEEIVRQANEQN